MQTLKLYNVYDFQEPFEIHANIATTSVSSSFGPLEHEKPSQDTLLIKGEFGLIVDQSCKVELQRRHYFEDGGHSQASQHLSGSLIEVSSNNFELQ